MTILLPVDAAYAFDYLAILEVKDEQKLQVADQLAIVGNNIRDQLGEIRMSIVLTSHEFYVLLEANRRIFLAIEKAHRDKISARKVQEINYARYLAKKALQEKFWPNSPLAEQKTKL